VYYLRDFASTDTQISAMGPRVCELWPLEFDCRRDFDLKLVSDAWRGARERGRLLRLRTTNFYPCSIQWYQTGPDRTVTSWTCLRNKLELISWRSSFRTCGVPVQILKTYSL